jgi:hypothetical protein
MPTCMRSNVVPATTTWIPPEGRAVFSFCNILGCESSLWAESRRAGGQEPPQFTLFRAPRPVGLKCRDDPIGIRSRHRKPSLGRACEELSRNARRQSSDVRSAPCTAAHAESCRIGKAAIDRIRALLGAHRSSADDFPVVERLGSAKSERLDAAHCSPNHLRYPPIPSTRVLAKGRRMVTSIPACPSDRPLRRLADAVHSGQSTIRDGERATMDHQLRQLRGPSRHHLSIQLFILRLVRCAPATTCYAALSVAVLGLVPAHVTQRLRRAKTHRHQRKRNGMGPAATRCPCDFFPVGTLPWAATDRRLLTGRPRHDGSWPGYSDGDVHVRPHLFPRCKGR